MARMIKHEYSKTYFELPSFCSRTLKDINFSSSFHCWLFFIEAVDSASEEMVVTYDVILGYPYRARSWTSMILVGPFQLREILWLYTGCSCQKCNGDSQRYLHVSSQMGQLLSPPFKPDIQHSWFWIPFPPLEYFPKLCLNYFLGCWGQNTSAQYHQQSQKQCEMTWFPFSLSA